MTVRDKRGKISETVWLAIRLDTVTNEEWADLGTVAYTSDAAVRQANRADRTRGSSAWAAANPVRRAAEFQIGELGR